MPFGDVARQRIPDKTHGMNSLRGWNFNAIARTKKDRSTNCYQINSY
ncbi:hypothetical protein [Polaromonas sp. CG9_12]|nr:hypothetical protein [Polaromonas sp. CG9_12]